MEFSIVVPVYGCPEALTALHDRITRTMKKISKSYEIILVNDACPKGSWQIIQQLCKKHKNTIGINLSRNFGQIHATNAGISLSKGKYVILMDCDLQDKPEGITDLYDKLLQGYDIVFARRKNRKDNRITLFFSRLFYCVYNFFVEGYYDPDVGNFCIVKRKIVDEYLTINDNNKSFTTTLSWMGYNLGYVDIDSEERFSGSSSYTFFKKINLAIDMLTSQSNKPLKAIIYLGFIFVFLSFIYLISQVLSYFIHDDIAEGWTSIIASIFLMGGLMLASIGAVGIYVGNIFSQTKGLPGYLIKETINLSKAGKK